MLDCKSVSDGLHAIELGILLLAQTIARTKLEWLKNVFYIIAEPWIVQPALWHEVVREGKIAARMVRCPMRH